MAFKWNNVVDIIQSEETRARSMGKSIISQLAQLESQERERNETLAREQKRLSTEAVMQYVNNYANKKALDEIYQANEQLGQMGILYEPIPINQQIIQAQRQSGGVWAQNYITYAEAAYKKAQREGAMAEAEKWARWNARQKGINWNDLSPRQQESYRNWWYQKIMEETQAPEPIMELTESVEAPEFTPQIEPANIPEVVRKGIFNTIGSLADSLIGLGQKIISAPFQVLDFLENVAKGKPYKEAASEGSQVIVFPGLKEALESEEGEGFFKDNFIDPLLLSAVSFKYGTDVNFNAILPSVLSNFAGKLKETGIDVVTIPGQVGAFLSATAQGKSVAEANEIAQSVMGKATEPISMGIDEFASRLFPDIQSYAEQNFIRLTNEYNRWLEANPELQPKPEYLENPFENPELFGDFGYYVYSFSSSLAYSLAVMGILVGVSAIGTPAAGIPAAIIMASSPEAADMLQTLYNAGVPFEEAVQWSLLYGLTAGSIETITDLPFLGLIFKPVQKVTKPFWNAIFKGVAYDLAKRVVAGAVVATTEGFEEAMTQAVHNAILKYYDPNQRIVEGMGHSFIQAVIASLPFAAIGGMGSHRTFRNNLTQRVRDEYDRLVEHYKEQGLTEPEAQVQAVNELAKNPEYEQELDNAIKATRDEYEGRPVSKPTEAKAQVAEEKAEEISPEQAPVQETTEKVEVTPAEQAKTTEIADLRNKLVEKQKALDKLEELYPDDKKQIRTVKNEIKYLQDEIATLEKRAEEIATEQEEAPTQIVEQVPEISPEVQALRTRPIGELTREEIKTVGVRDLARKFGRLKTKIKNLPVEYKTTAQNILSGYDVAFRTKRTLNRRQAMLDYIARLREEGIEPNIPDNLIDMANRIPLSEMTMEQLDEVYRQVASLVHLGSLKNKLIRVQSRRKVKTAVDKLLKALGEIPKAPGIALKSTKEDAFLNKDAWGEGFINRHWRVPRLFLEFDGFNENGEWSQTFNNAIVDAQNTYLELKFGFLEDTERQYLKEHNLDIGKMLTHKTKIGGYEWTDSERMGVYLNSLNQDNYFHLRGNEKLTPELIQEVVDSLSTAEKAYADFMQVEASKYAPEISRIRTAIEGRGLDVVENYWPIIPDWQAVPEIDDKALAKMNYQEQLSELEAIDLGQQLAQEGGLRFAARWASSRIGKRFTRQRTHKAMQPVNLDSIMVFHQHLDRVHRYIAYAETIRDLQLIVKNPNFKRGVVLKQGRSRYEILDKWLKDVADPDPLRVKSKGEGILRQLRTNAVLAITGINLVMSLRQTVSWFTGMAEAGELNTLKGLWDTVSHYRKVRDLMKQYDQVTYRRSWAWEYGEKGMARLIQGKATYKDALSFLVRTADRLTVTAIWKGAFDGYLKEHPDDYQGAAREAHRVITRTQPAFDIKDLAEYYRSGEAMKAFLMWTNQLNQNVNYYRFDIAGKYAAGKISKATLVRRIMEAFVLPALLFGMTVRSRPPEDAKEVLQDLGAQAVGSSFAFINMLSGVMRGYQPDVNIVTTQVVELAMRAMYQAERQNWEGLAQTMPEIVGYLGGFPTVQPKRFIQAIQDLAGDKSDDWLRLIWGRSTRDKYIKEDKVSTDALNEVSNLFYDKDFNDCTKEQQQIVLAIFE